MSGRPQFVIENSFEFLWCTTSVSLCMCTRQGYQADFNVCCVRVNLYTHVDHCFTVSFGKQTAGWCRSQYCYWAFRELK